MKGKHTLTEHYLVPAVLFMLNICLVHLIHAFTEDPVRSPLHKTLVAAAFVLLASSLLFKKQAHMTSSILFYILVALML